MDLNSSFTQLKNECHLHPYLPIKERKEALLTLKKLVQTHAEEIAQTVNQDFNHRARYETLLLEIFPLINAINYCLKYVKKWAKPRKRHVSWLFKPAYSSLLPQPLGVVGIIVPWNYPVLLAFGPLVYALAAGNRIMVKSSELTPVTGNFLEKMIQNSSLKNQIIIVNGGVEVSQEFASLPFDHLLFTGSTKIGKMVMQEAAKNLTPVTLELGGKSPVFVSITMNPQHFQRLIMGKIVNAGQTCIAPDYLLIPRNWEEQIEHLSKEVIAKRYPQLLENEDYSSIISTTHQKRLENMLEDACQKGARLVQIGSESQNQKMPFSLLFNVNDSMKVMQEEIFGPILPIVTYDNLDEAIKQINNLANPLVIYYFGDDKLEKEALKVKTLSGALTINDTLTHLAIDSLPFGGVGQSGFGYYHGPEGFNTFSKLKPIFVQRRFTTVQWFYPPHGKLINFLLSKISGINLRERT